MIIKSNIKNFKVSFVNDFKFVKNLSQLENYVVIVGEDLYKIYKKEIFNKFNKDKIITLKLNEQNKTLETAVNVYDILLRQTAKKNLTIISFGGGINQDVVGFVASTLYRGVGWIYVPTTLLAMADSAIGLKTSLNFKQYKNVIGTFYPPDEIIINVDFLKTLSKLSYFSGMGEIIKLYLMQPRAIKKLKNTLIKINVLQNRKDKNKTLKIIQETMNIKSSYMKGDEFDRGRRNLLNYGHEFGHALESSSDFKIPHGIAILIGIIFANLVAYDRKLIDREILKKLNDELLLPNIPIDVLTLRESYFNTNQIIKSMRKDKKNIASNLVLVIPDKNFSLIKINDLTVEELKSNMLELKKLLPLTK